MQYELKAVPGIAGAGVLHVAGPNVMKGYLLYENPGVIQPPKSVHEGWYSTGDIVHVDDDGFLHIRGRVKRFAKVAGEMISLEVVERIAATASPTLSHAASSRADTAKGEALVLFTTDSSLKREQLSAAAKTLGLPEIAVPRILKVLTEIPLLGTGKTDYVLLKKMTEDLSAEVSVASAVKPATVA
jgi:acyl-[acyl-carrier-protein]-phospholipid O-acyltransferase/long-chain-fatty-acid--[acyl-carrier-protein] ligase